MPTCPYEEAKDAISRDPAKTKEGVFIALT
jgi:hypothetical protein